jgi:aspartyl-tRNA(Asn)/glutamyl-tRNA(Gln) amidotransferase subunit A
VSTEEAQPTIAAVAPKIARGEIRAEKLAEEALSRIAELQPTLNAFITVTADDALAAARQADKDIAAGRYRGPLHGIPISLKDLIDMQGVPTTAASRLRAEHVARRDAPVTARLRVAGAVLVGKTNLHEFAFGTTTEDSGWGPARNPIDPSRSPGGSSGGSAIGVRTGMSFASVGTDTGGSIRIPAAACGIVGLKPAWNEISAEGVVPLSRQLDHVGPLARSVEDASTIYDVMRGAAVSVVQSAPLWGRRFGLLSGYFMEKLDEHVEAAVLNAIDALRRNGAAVTDVTLPHAADIAPVYLHLVLADAAAYHATMLQERPAAYTPNVRLRLEMGRYVLAEDYVRALEGRRVLAREVERALDGLDALLLPALSIPAPVIGDASVAVKGGREPVRNAMLRCTQPFNLTSHPAISLPCGTTPAGLPVGLQIVGRLGETPELLRAARSIEAALDRRA